MSDLSLHIAVLQNGACHPDREEGQVDAQVNGIHEGLRPTAVHIHTVGNPMNCPEGERHDASFGAKHQSPQVQTKSQKQHKLSGLLLPQVIQKQSAHIVGQNRKQQNEKGTSASPGADEQASQKQKQIPALFWNQVIGNHKDRKKPEQKRHTVKNHLFSPQNTLT